MVLPDSEVKFQLSPKGLYYFDAEDRENGVLILNTVSENRGGFTQRESQQVHHSPRFPGLLVFPLCKSSPVL